MRGVQVVRGCTREGGCGLDVGQRGGAWSPPPWSVAFSGDRTVQCPRRPVAGASDLHLCLCWSRCLLGASGGTKSSARCSGKRLSNGDDS